MHSFISKVNGFIYVINNNSLYKYNTELELQDTRTYEHKLIYLKENYAIDEKKNLFDILTGEIIVKLSKNISDLQTKDKLYICTRFGDICCVTDHEQLIFGNMCLTTSMVLHDYIWTGDRYGRIRISDYRGKIFKYIFLKSTILNMAKYKNYVAVSTDSKKFFLIDIFTFKIQEYLFDETIIKILPEDTYLYLIFKEKTILYVYDNELQQKSFYMKAFIDGIVKDKDEYFLTSNGQIHMGDELKVKLDAKYEMNYHLLQKYSSK
ncbi:hypothetical protein COBT_002446 [Conglomerata obtusa]